MADEKMTAVQKFYKDQDEKGKSYKTPHDVERVHHMAAALQFLRDHTAAAPLVGSIGRELAAMALKQGEQDAKDIVERQKALADAQAADAKTTAEEDESSSPPRARAGRA